MADRVGSHSSLMLSVYLMFDIGERWSTGPWRRSWKRGSVIKRRRGSTRKKGSQFSCLLSNHWYNFGSHVKESILDLSKHLDKKIRVKYSGGREGILNPDCSQV